MHFGIENKAGNDPDVISSQRNDLFSKLIETLKDPVKIPQDWKPEIIVISGDVAFSGASEEYYQFKRTLFPALCELLQQKTNENHILICPGNHDIIRERVKPGINGPRVLRPKKEEFPISSDIPELTLSSVMDKDEGRWHHFEHFIAYCCENTPDQLCRTATFSKWPWLHFLVLNSAWDCRDNKDEGCLRVGYNIAHSLYSKTPKVMGNNIFVAVFHHPLIRVSDQDKTGKKTVRDWLHSSERYYASDSGVPNFGSFITQSMSFVLNGHVHIPCRPIRLNNSYHFINGTVHSNDTYTYHCRIIKINREKPSAYIDLSRRLSDLNQKWETTTPVFLDDSGESRRPEWDKEIAQLLSDFNNAARVFFDLNNGTNSEEQLRFFNELKETLREIMKKLAKYGINQKDELYYKNTKDNEMTRTRNLSTEREDEV